jgi:hypothetical protein
MTITRNVGTAAGSLAANTAALQAAISLGAGTDDVRIVLGANARFECVGFTTNVTAFPMVIIAADRNNPPIMTEGFRFCGDDGEGWFEKLPANGANSVQDITIDGIHFIPRHITQSNPGPIIPGEPTNHPYVFQDDPPGGYAYRIDPTFEGFDASKRNQGYGAGAAYMKALTGFNGTQDILVQNCYFRGYGRAIECGGANGFIFRFNTWESWHEDIFWIAGGNNITIEYNLFDRSQTISYRDAHWGFWYGATAIPPGQIPPHPDAIQTFRPTDNFLVQFNAHYDSGASHFVLHQINNQGGTHTNSIIRNNFSEQADSTGIWAGDAQGLRCERNKILRVAGGTESVILQIYADNNPGAQVHDNRAPRLFTNGAANWAPGSPSGNVQTNDPNNMPPGWIEFRRGHPNLVPGAPFAGQYGGTGAVVPTAPAGLEAGEVAFRALVQDPDFLDARRTFTITVPKRIIRFTGGTASIAADTEINGGTSGATATTVAVPVVESGSYGASNAAGYIHIGPVDGTFVVGENIRVVTTTRSQVSVVPNSSPASSANLMRWVSDENDTIRDMIQLADDGSDQVWRASRPSLTGTAHLRSPTFTFTNVTLYYRVGAATLLSDPSEYTFTETVPDIGEPDPIVSLVVDLDQTRRFATTDGDFYSLATLEDGIIWRAPC